MQAAETDEPNAKAPAHRGSPWLRTSAIVLLLAFCMGSVAVIGWLVLREIDSLNSTNSDNIQWSLAQADVEFLRMELALRDAQEDPAQLDAFRRRFDIFYSRLNTLENGAVFRALRQNPDYDVPRAHVRRFLEDGVPVIDGTDAELLAALPDLERQLSELTEDVRQLSLSGLAAFAVISDTRREEVMGTLVRLAMVLGLLLGSLSLLALSFQRLYRLSERQARILEQTGARVRTIVETSMDPIIVCDESGRITDFNYATTNLFGWTRFDAIAEPFLDICFPEDIRGDLREGALKFLSLRRKPKFEERQFETLAVSARGRRFPVEVSIDRAEDDGGRVYVAFIRDISRRRAAEEGLTVARDKALAGEKAKAEFLAVMSHEMRTPLNGLLGTMQLMRDHDLTERQNDLLDHMQSSGRLLLGLVNDVLDLAKYEAGKIELDIRPFSVQRLLDGVIETTASLAAQNGNALSCAWIGSPADHVMGDSRRLRQALLNLVGNAVKFTRGGTVDVEVEQLAGDIVEFRVIDTGIGIAPDDLERIFHDFETLDSSYRRKVGGTGLGLGITRRLVGLMGGEIGVESEPGEGSLFWLRLPLPAAGADVQNPAAPVPELSRPTRPLTVLLVEDNEINRFVAREMLAAEGHEVVEAVNGRAGVEWANARAFDAILMDISMPVMDGEDAARAIRSGNGPSRDVPIIAVTAHALPEQVDQFRESGMDYCIAKPIDRMVLARTLHAISVGETAHPAAPKNGQEMFDPRQFQDILDTLGPDSAQRLLTKFLTETETAIATLASGPTDATDLAGRAHKAAGSCATFGLVRLRSALNAIETQAERGAVSAGDLAELATLWTASRKALDRHLAAAG